MSLNCFSALVFFSCAVVVLPGCFCQDTAECIEGPSHLYSGTYSMTKTGIRCQRWDVNHPHQVKEFPQDNGKHNYCRNPDMDASGTWCYTSDPNVRWEYCGIPKCDDNVEAVFTSFDPIRKMAHLGHMKADPEFVSQYGFGSDDSVHKKMFEKSEFRVLEAGRNGEELFFTEVRNDYCGVFNPKTTEIELISEGSAKTIYAMSQDWVTANFYWTDTKMKWVYVSDRQFRAMLPMYKTAPSEPRAIAVHPVERWVVFSTFLKVNSDIRDTEIIMTDLAGRNPKVLFKYPDVIDVTGLTVDEERIYWCDYLGYESKVISARFDGTGRTEHYTKRFGNFKDIAVYSDYIYVTDSQKRYNYFDHIRYHIDIVRKDSDEKVFQYPKPEIPHGIVILRKVEEDELPTPINGARSCLKMCGGVCLPDEEGEPECHCPLGYNIRRRTGTCVPRLVDDNYLLALDKVGGRLYQMPLRAGNYSIAPFGKTGMIASAAIDPSSGTVYLFDKSKKEIRKGSLNRPTEIVHAPVDTGLKHMAVDPATKNIYYVDENNNINVVEGIFREVIFENNENTSDVKMIALDVNNKYVYWTDTFSEDGRGKVMRCRFDGKQKKTVLDNLERPHGITLDIKSRNVYVLDAKSAIIYEIPIMNKFRKLRLNGPKITKHDLKPLVEARRFSFSEIAVHEGFAYIADEETPHLLKYKLNKPRYGTLSNFGPSIFYRAASLSVYSSRLYKSKYASFSNPCKQKKCQTMCITLNKFKSKCL